jgi:MFS family permease
VEDRGKHRLVYEWSLVIVLALMWGFVGLNRAGIGYIMPAIVPEFHLEFWMAGLLVSGTSIAWAVSAWASGCISDRIGRKPVLVVGMYAASFFSALFGLAVPLVLAGLFQLAIAPIILTVPETAPRVLARQRQPQPATSHGAVSA